MALPAYAYATVAELKRYMGFTGQGLVLEMEEALGRASLDVEGEGLGGRRGLYRGPVESYTGIVSAQPIVASGALALAGAPNSEGRTIVVRKNDPDGGLTAGTLTIAQAAPVLSETFDLTSGDELHGVQFFTAAVTATLSGCTGMNAGDTIDVGTSAGYTEFYSPGGCQGEIKPLEWPLRSVAAIHEDYNRLFPSGTLLVAGTDYELRNEGSIRRAIARLSGGLDTAWLAGRRVVRARLSAGWKGTVGVPHHVKGVVLELAAWHFQHVQGKHFGLASKSDAMGSRSYSGPPMLTSGMKARLAPEWRAEVDPTAERGWSEAA